MTMEIDIATDVAEQAIIVSELEKHGPSADDGHGHVENCANCGTHLQGAYCHACGQSSHIHRSLLHLIEELLHGLLHFETKAWRTVPALIFFPGKLTRNYIDGQRTRYVSPLALFLFSIFLMFFVFSLTAQNPLNNIADKPKTQAGIDVALTKSREKLISLQGQREKLAANDPKLTELDESIMENKQEIKALEISLQLISDNNSSKETGKPVDVDDRIGLAKIMYESQGHSNFPALDAKINHALKTPELTLYKLMGNTSKWAFLLMPISLPFLWLMFIFKRKYGMFDHAVFSLYSLSFMAVLLMVTAILNKLSFSKVAILLVLFTPPVHMFVQLRGAYQLGLWASTWRTIALLFVALCSLMIYMLLVVGMSM